MRLIGDWLFTAPAMFFLLDKAESLNLKTQEDLVKTKMSKQSNRAAKLPQDVLEEILSRCPPKSLLRFTCVCKSWFSSISSPRFVNHINHAINIKHKKKEQDTRETLTLICCRTSHSNEIVRRSTYTLYHEKNNRVLVKSQEFGLLERGDSLVGASKSLVCFQVTFPGNSFIQNFVLWSPSIRKQVTLPAPRIAACVRTARVVSGFWFHAKTNDYKLIRIVYHVRELPYSLPPEVELYELSKNAWRPIIGAPLAVIGQEPTVVLNGAIHFPQVGWRFVVAFDAGDETFRYLDLPADQIGDRQLRFRSPSLTVIDGMLSLLCCNNSRYGHYELWMMKDYGVPESWTKQYTLNLDLKGNARILGCKNDGQTLLLQYHCRLALYDLETLRLSPLLLLYSSSEVTPFYMADYVESLTLLDRLTQLELYEQYMQYNIH